MRTQMRKTLCAYDIRSIFGLIYAYFNIATYEYINWIFDTHLFTFIYLRILKAAKSILILQTFLTVIALALIELLYIFTIRGHVC